MAPKKATAAQKSKNKAQEGSSRGATPPGALPESRVSEAALEDVSYLLASSTHALGATNTAVFGGGRPGACFSLMNASTR